MNNSTLKTIAIVTMLIDHTGAILFPQLFALRIIGRIAFPIFAFLLVEGFFHTSNRKRYLIRLLAFAIISEIPFDYGFFHEPFYMGYQNIFFTLCLGLCAMMVIEKVKEYNQVQSMRIAYSGIVIVAVGLVSEVLHTDYGYIGIVTIMLFYIFRAKKVLALSSVGMFHIYIGLMSAGFPDIQNAAYAVQALAALSMPILYFYNGKKGWSMKYFFYAFYPVHILILAGISQLLITN